MLRKLETWQRLYRVRLINVFATQQFCIFRWLLFPLLKLANSFNYSVMLRISLLSISQVK